MIRVQARTATHAEILIYDPIGQNWFGDGFTAKRFNDEIEALGDVKDITVRINSPGGEVFDGFTIYNILKNHPAQVHVQIEGLAASIASVIAMAGDLVSMGEGTMLMIHDPWSVAIGDAEDMRASAEMLDKVKEGILDAYQARTGKDRAELATMMEAETWLTASEAIEHRFADVRIGEEAAADERPAAALTGWAQVMACFNNAPSNFPMPGANPAPGANPPAITGMSTTEDPMDKTTTVPVTTGDDGQEAVKAALQAEKARRADIRDAFGKHADAQRALLDACLEDQDCTADNARQQLLAKLSENITPLREPTITAGGDARDRFITGASQAVLARSGAAEREAGNEYNGATLVTLASHALRHAGISCSGMSPDQVARKVLASTSDFPELLANSAGKILRNAYSAFPSTWRGWCGVREVSDFKQIKNIQLGAFNNLDLIPEGGEYTYGEFTEEAEANAAATKGKGLKMTRQMIVNDDLGGFNRRARMLGTAAARTVNADAYAVINANAAMADGVALFHANHSNLLTAGAITVDNLSKGKAAMRKQKDAGGKEYLNILPSTLLVPVALEDLAREIITSTTKDGQTNSAKPNVLRNFVNVVSDPKLDESSATAWYLVADPMVAELVQAVFLDGNETPFIDEDVEFNTDAMLMKVRLDYGFAAVDWRAGQKNAGA